MTSSSCLFVLSVFILFFNSQFENARGQATVESSPGMFLNHLIFREFKTIPPRLLAITFNLCIIFSELMKKEMN